MLVSNLSLLKWNLCESILMEHLLLLSRQTRPTNPRSSECSCQIKPLFWGFFWQVWHVQGCGLFHQFACCLSLLLQFSHLYILEKAKLLTKRSQPINGHFPPTEKCSSFGHPSMVRDIICPMDLWIWLTMLPCLLLGWKHSQELKEFQNWIKAVKNSST